MKSSSLIGVVLNAEPVLRYKKGGEKFYSILMSFKDVQLPVLYSEHTKPELTGSLIEVTGILVSDISKGVPACYFYSNSLKPADPDAEQSNTISVFGHVNRVGKVSVNSNGHDQLPVTLLARWVLGGRSLIYTVLRDKQARKHQNLALGSPVRITGHIARYRDIVEVVAESVKILK